MDRGSPGSAFGTECSCRSAGSIAARDVPSQSPRVANAPTLQVATRLRSFLPKYLKRNPGTGKAESTSNRQIK